MAELLEINRESLPLAPPSPATHGLAHVRSPVNGDDIHVGTGAGGVEPYIRCRPVRPDMGSSCDHHFEWGPLDIQLSYAREHLPRWQEVQDRATALLKALEVTVASDQRR